MAGALLAAACGRSGLGADGAGSAVAVKAGTSSRSWPNEPAGLTPRGEWGFDQDPPDSGDQPIPGSPSWKIVSPPASVDPRGWVARVADPSAPFSPPSVYDFVYPRGMVEGTAPATVYYDGLDAREFYVRFWWKPSAPFDLGPNGNKVAFLFNGGGAAGGQQFLILLPDGRLHILPEYPGDFRWRHPNVSPTAVTLGAWHVIEWHSDLDRGLLEWWLDGTLQGRHEDVRNDHVFDMFQFSPTWGGNAGAVKRHADHYWFDHVYLSVH
jgi:hypothetical protein